MSTAPIQRQFTVAEYVAMEQDSASKHEFYRGEVFAMAGLRLSKDEAGKDLVVLDPTAPVPARSLWLALTGGN